MHVTTSMHVSQITNAVPNLGADSEDLMVHVVLRHSEEISSRKLKHKE